MRNVGKGGRYGNVLLGKGMLASQIMLRFFLLFVRLIDLEKFVQFLVGDIFILSGYFLFIANL